MNQTISNSPSQLQGGPAVEVAPAPPPAAVKIHNQHRDSGASDASNSHLMVYDESQERKSSISFDKIRQISLTYSLQSEGEEEGEGEAPPLGPSFVAGTETSAATTTRTSGELLPNGASDVALEMDQTSGPVDGNEAPSPTPFVLDAGGGGNPNGIPHECSNLKSNENGRNQASSEQRLARNPYALDCTPRQGHQDQVKPKPTTTSPNNSTISFKLARNTSANIIIDNDNQIKMVQEAGSAGAYLAGFPTANEDLAEQFASSSSTTVGPVDYEQLSSENSSSLSCWDCAQPMASGDHHQQPVSSFKTDYQRAAQVTAAGSSREEHNRLGQMQFEQQQQQGDQELHKYQIVRGQQQRPSPLTSGQVRVYQRDPNARVTADQANGGERAALAQVAKSSGPRVGPGHVLQSATVATNGQKAPRTTAASHSRQASDNFASPFQTDAGQEMLVGRSFAMRANPQRQRRRPLVDRRPHDNGGDDDEHADQGGMSELRFENGRESPHASSSWSSARHNYETDKHQLQQSTAPTTTKVNQQQQQRQARPPERGDYATTAFRAATRPYGQFAASQRLSEQQQKRWRTCQQQQHYDERVHYDSSSRWTQHSAGNASSNDLPQTRADQVRGSSLGRFQVTSAGPPHRHHAPHLHVAGGQSNWPPATQTPPPTVMSNHHRHRHHIARGSSSVNRSLQSSPVRRPPANFHHQRSQPNFSGRRASSQYFGSVAPRQQQFDCRLCVQEQFQFQLQLEQQRRQKRFDIGLWPPDDEQEPGAEEEEEEEGEEEELELELGQEAKQISIIIGTPKRRAWRPVTSMGDDSNQDNHLNQSNNNSRARLTSASSSSTTPTRRQPTRDEFDYQQDYSRSQQLQRHRQHHDHELSRRQFIYDDQEHQEDTTQNDDNHQRGELVVGSDQDAMQWGPRAFQSNQASDNLKMSQRQRRRHHHLHHHQQDDSGDRMQGRAELARRSTISTSSSEGGEGECPPAAFYNGRQFQRRPTGPFDVSTTAGGRPECPQEQPHDNQKSLLVAARSQQKQTLKQQQEPSDHQKSELSQQGRRAQANEGQPDSSTTASQNERINLDATPGQAVGGSASGIAQTTDKDASAPSMAAAGLTTTTKTPPAPQAAKPIKLRNLLNDETTVDHLHQKYKNNNRSHGCDELRCLGSMINPKPVEQRVRTGEETWAQAKEFIDGYYTSIKRFDTAPHKNRLKEIEEQIRSSDTYYLRETELIYGAKLAWRNAPRCIGRIQWSKLQVFDARFTRNANEMFEAICNHIKYATNRGSLRSAITIFPQRVKSTKNDWRVWNPQLIGYAGYRDKTTAKVVAGDPANVDITEVCQKLGWQGKGGNFDVLPVVLSANGGPPQLFKLPEELVLRVPIKHPKLDWFQELGLEWYALPAVSSMMLDLGGLQFTACPFNGWYMVTEVGTRDLADTSRYNMLEPIAQRMGLSTTTNMSLWRDQALTQLNLAVLDSYQQAGVTIVDHHTACETFMTHLKNEQRLRGGCPADWVWLVPPTAGSTTQVFHQEMVNYHLLPNYEYQPPAWKNFDWARWERLKREQREHDESKASPASKALSFMSSIKASTSSLSPFSKHRIGINQVAAAGSDASSPGNLTASPGSQTGAAGTELTPRHLRFKEIARAVKFTSKLFGKALSRRIKATILYATETGKSERFANKLAQTFSHAFNVHLMSMSDYDMTCLEHEALLLIVTSTFGNGDPPENGELFAKHLAAIKMTGDSSPDIDSINSVATNPFFQMLSEDHKDGLSQSAAVAAAVAAAASVPPSKGPLNGDGSQAESLVSDSGGHREAAAMDDSDESSSTSGGDDRHGPTNLGVGVAGSKSSSALAAAAKSGTKSRGTNATTKHHNHQEQHQQLHCLNQEQQTNIRPLSNVRFAVFALGSTAYPHFCAFGRYVDQTLGELGAERILKCCCGDELCGQEKAFNEWSNQVFRVACDVFCLTDTMEPIDDRPETIWTPKDVRFEYVEGLLGELQTQTDASADLAFSAPPTGPTPFNNQTSVSTSKSAIIQNLVSIVGKKIVPFNVKRRIDLHEYVVEEGLQTICVDLDSGLRPIKFQPGDHIGIYPVNKFDVVDKILKRIEQDLKLSSDGASTTIAQQHNMDRRVSILVKRGNMDPLTQGDEWVQCDTLPITSIREALTRYLDITNTPNQDFLSILARQTSDPEDKKCLQQMARNFTIYEEWKNKQAPSLLSTLEEFKTVRFDPALITQIPPMKPRFYSVSGTSISLTLGVVRYKTARGEPREGLCSNYLNSVQVDPKSYVFGYVRSAPAFHMPQDTSLPMLLISAGTGIAPFRAFWQQRYSEMEEARKLPGSQLLPSSQIFGRMEFYFGCRNSRYILYRNELETMHEQGVLSSINIAFSRPLDRDVFEAEQQQASNNSNNAATSDQASKSKIVDSIRQARKKMYVQDKLIENHELVFKSIIHDGAHIYVCGDVAMADGVYKTLAKIINNNFKANQRQMARQQTASSNSDKSPATVSAASQGNKSGSVDLVEVCGEDGESVLMNLRNMNRYHEDIFGAKQV